MAFKYPHGSSGEGMPIMNKIDALFLASYYNHRMYTNLRLFRVSIVFGIFFAFF